MAASACARLLARGGIAASIESANRPKIPALLIGDATQALFAGVFESARIFEGARRITRRIVKWGGETRELAHSGVVIGEKDLEDRLRSPAGSGADGGDWTILAAPAENGSKTLDFGSRMATACRIRLKDEAQRESCWIEAVDGGWLFLLPDWLLSIGAPPGELLGRARVISGELSGTESASGTFPAYPRIRDPLCGEGWLACGSAAMAFDPIAGDGAGNALREAILAAAVIRAAERGEPVDDLLEHYRARLTAGFARHLELCRPFYAAIEGEWWREETAAIDRGIAWCGERLRGHEYRYQLRDFDLISLENSATKRW